MTNYKNQKILKKRLRDENNVPYGMVVALNRNQLGYSICHSKLDTYNDDIAFKIAVSRAKSHKDTNADFWIERRKRHLKENPIAVYFCESGRMGVEELDEEMLQESIDYILENDDWDAFDQREIVAFAELKIMQNRANKYFKET